MIVRPAQSQNAVLKTHKGKGGHINEICKYEKNDGMFDGCTDGMVCISDQKLYYITGRQKEQFICQYVPVDPVLSILDVL